MASPVGEAGRLTFYVAVPVAPGSQNETGE